MQDEPDVSSKISIYKRELIGLRDITNYLNMQSIATRGLFILAILYTLYFAGELLIPIFFAFWFYFLLKPLVNYMHRKWHVSKYLAAAIVLVLGLFVVGATIFLLSAQAQGWMEGAPQTFDKFNAKLASLTGFLRDPMEFFIKISQKIKDSLHLPTSQTTQASWVGLVFASTWGFLVQFSIFIVFLFFLLASEKSFLTKLVTLSLPTEHRSEAYKVVGQIEGKIWAYIFARTAINAVSAIVFAIVFAILGLPNPILWAVIVALLEYIPYLGAAISLALIIVISVVSFDPLWQMLAVPLVFFVLINVEGNIVAPYVMGKTFVLDPIEVVLAIIFFGWIWGASGAFLSIPLIMSLKIILDTVSEDNFMKTLSE